MTEYFNARQFIGELVGQDNTLTIPRWALTITGNDHLAAMLMSQLMYWQPRATKQNEHWIIKSAADWQDELGMSGYQVTRAIAKLHKLGFPIETKTAKSPMHGMAPTKHYKVDMVKAIDFVKIHYQETAISDIQETAISYIETTGTQSTVEQGSVLPKEGNTLAAPEDGAAIEVDSDIAAPALECIFCHQPIPPTAPHHTISEDEIMRGLKRGDPVCSECVVEYHHIATGLADALTDEPKEKLLSPAQAMQKAIRDAFGSDGLTKAHYGIIGRKAKELMNSTPPYTGDDVGFMVAWARLPAQKKEFWNGIKILDLHKIAYSWAQAGRPKVYDESKMTLQHRVDAGLEHPDAIHLADPDVEMFTEWTPEYEAELLADGCTQEAIDISKRLFKHCEHPELTPKSQEAGDDCQ